MRIIDADELKEQLKLRFENAYKWRCETIYKEKADGAIAAFLEAIRTLNNAPTVDAIPVIRCKDCKWFTRYAEIKSRESGCCTKLKPAGDGHFICWGDWYCKDGERKDDK